MTWEQDILQALKKHVKEDNTPLYDPSIIAKNREIAEWKAKGRPVPPPHIIKQQTLIEYAKKYGLRVFVETGTYYGEMVDVMKNTFDHIYSIELGDALYENARKRFAGLNHIEIIHGDSGVELADILNKIDSPALFWLDGHYSEGVTVKGKVDTPIREELVCILNAPDKGHVIIIDDARCFGTDPAYPSIDELTEFIKSKRPNVDIVVENDSIRVTPVV